MPLSRSLFFHAPAIIGAIFFTQNSATEHARVVRIIWEDNRRVVARLPAAEQPQAIADLVVDRSRMNGHPKGVKFAHDFNQLIGNAHAIHRKGNMLLGERPHVDATLRRALFPK